MNENRKGSVIAIIIFFIGASIIPSFGAGIVENSSMSASDDTSYIGNLGEPTIVSISPSTQVVENGATFSVDVFVEPGEPIVGVNVGSLSFDPDIIHAVSVTEGDIFPPFNCFCPHYVIDNTVGEIRILSWITLPPTAVSDPGTFCTIEFTAQYLYGTSVLDLEGIAASDINGDPVLTIVVNDGEVIVKGPTIVSIFPSTQNVENGETFFVDVYVEPGEPIVGVNVGSLSFDPNLIQANLVTEGNLFDGITTFFMPGTIDNVAGDITGISVVTLPPTGVTDTGTFCTIEFIAQDLYGTSVLDLEGVGAADELGNPVSVVVNDGEVRPPPAATLTIIVIGIGTTDPPPGVYPMTYPIGTIISISAIEIDPDWYFSGWVFNDEPFYDNPFSITLVQQDTVIIATFTLWHTLDITIVGNGTVTKNPDQSIYPHGATVELESIADPDWHFDGWVGDISSGHETDNPVSILMDMNKYVTATFIKPPEITDVMLTASDPLDTEPGFGWENITCTVTDNVAVDTVQLNITAHSPQIVSMTSIGGDVFFCNITLTDAGNYTYHIWADDTSNNQAESTPDIFSLPPNWDVNMDGCGEFWDLVAISYKWGQTGPPGWIREDVDNLGMVEFWDLVDVSFHYGE